ncbi:hypothetical protein L1987_47287 [Smallanthus sonchifolius]|uniref:Uncharacterized protein n=1 Tax=Smallanthus sonchifolius TaxID=185202 RepID=A0ACB9G263_9ASTR|nr:hypothetical protein L1987_47287 [Smallanthus sonchifolius]
MDSDASGTVEFDELVNAMSSQMMTEDILMNQHQLLEIFKSFDRDGSGFITPAELAKSMTKMGQPLTYRELSEMVRDADTDGVSSGRTETRKIHVRICLSTCLSTSEHSIQGHNPKLLSPICNDPLSVGGSVSGERRENPFHRSHRSSNTTCSFTAIL